MRETNSSKVYECIGKSDYIMLKYNDKCYRVKDKLFKPVPATKYNFGEIVKVKGKEDIGNQILWRKKGENVGREKDKLL